MKVEGDQKLNGKLVSEISIKNKCVFATKIIKYS